MATSSEGGETPEAAPAEAKAAAVSERSRPGRGVPIDLGDVFREARTTFAAAWPECLIVYWGAGAASWLILFVLRMMLGSLGVLAGDRDLVPFLEFSYFLGFFLIPAWIFCLGRDLAMLKIARREPVVPDTLFQCGPRLLTFLLAAAIVASPCLIIYASAEALLAFHGDRPLVEMIRIMMLQLAVPDKPPVLPPATRTRCSP